MEVEGSEINQVEELTSSDAEEKRDIKEGVPSDDDLWGGVIERSCNMLLLIMIILTEMREATAHILFFRFQKNGRSVKHLYFVASRSIPGQEACVDCE